MQGGTNRCFHDKLFIDNLYTEYELSILYVCGDTFDEIMIWSYGGRTEGLTEPRTDVNQYTPCFFKAEVQQRRTNRTKPVLYPAIQLVVLILYLI